MIKSLKRIFNSTTAIVIISVLALFIFITFSILLKKISTIMICEGSIIILLIGSFFLINRVMVGLNKRFYPSFFTFVTIWAMVFFMVFPPILLLIIHFILKIVDSKESNLLFSYFSFLVFFYTAWVWSIYLNFCIRILNSINVKCSVFVAITVKAILIAIVAWLALYKDSETDKSYIINFITSYISLCYPIIDMFKYVRLEFDKYMKENIIIIK